MKVTERAAQIWPVLALAARNRQTLTYEIVEGLTGQFRAGLGPCLDPIQAYCVIHELPPLTALVVEKGSGIPGTGFTAAADVPHAQAQVFAFDWSAHKCPTAEAFRDAIAETKSQA